MPFGRRPPSSVAAAPSSVDDQRPTAPLPAVDTEPDPGGVGFQIGVAIALVEDGASLVYQRCGALTASGNPHRFYGIIHEAGVLGAVPVVATTRGSQVTPQVEGGVPLTPDEPVFLSVTPGMVTQDTSTLVSGTRVLKLGIALNTTTFLLATDWHYDL